MGVRITVSSKDFDSFGGSSILSPPATKTHTAIILDQTANLTTRKRVLYIFPFSLMAKHAALTRDLVVRVHQGEPKVGVSWMEPSVNL